MDELTAEERGRFQAAASAWIANGEIIDAVASGDLNRTPEEQLRPLNELLVVIQDLYRAHGNRLRGVVFRNWFFPMPIPRRGSNPPVVDLTFPIPMNRVARLD
ncbi:MAG: hypothetical protein MUF18_05565 [Fimbriiglobus sp.]|nr:hypothetical protein [Fimbriiglobus sp.]